MPRILISQKQRMVKKIFYLSDKYEVNAIRFSNSHWGSYSIQFLVPSKLLVFCPYLGAFKCFFQCHFMYKFMSICLLLWRRKRQPTPVLLPGEFQGQGSLVGYGPWDRRVGHDWAHSTQHMTPYSCFPERQPWSQRQGRPPKILFFPHIYCGWCMLLCF